MRIVLLNDYFIEKMGYSDNLLSRALAEAGHEVHIIAPALFPVFDKQAQELYKDFMHPLPEVGVTVYRGVTIHRLPHLFKKEGVWLLGLRRKLQALKPDIVQNVHTTTWNGLRSAWWSRSLGYKVFYEDHTHWSVFKLHPRWKRWVYGVMYGKLFASVIRPRAEKVYAIAPDVREISVKYYGMDPEKVVVESLGYDDSVFYEANDAASWARRMELRALWGIAEDEIAVIYTGRFTPGKHPWLLAEAVRLLREEGLPFRGVFVGRGTGAYAEQMASYADHGAVFLDFVPYTALGDYYRAADAGCWPRQESTSMLDAAACGIPVIASDTIHVRDRIEGNGYLYREDDPQDLAVQLRKLLDREHRLAMGANGAGKMRARYSWATLAARRIEDYQAALHRR